jgi:tetratricopeptide (TPR) repeat protein
MDEIIPIIGAPLVGSIVIIGIIVVILLKRGRLDRKKNKTQEVLLKEVNKRLAQNPRDPTALFTLADIYFKTEKWDKAFQTYRILEDLAGTNQHIDAFQVHLRYALSALQLGQKDEAYKGFNEAWTIRQDSLEVNYNLGNLEFQQNNYEKAVQYLSLARRQEPEHLPSLRCLGQAFYKLLKYKEAMAFIRKAIELNPEDTESLYILGKCYTEVGHTEQALKIFTHLRTDPRIGAEASLLAGNLNSTQHQLELAIEAFEIGLKHENIKPEILQNLRYGLAIAYLKKNEIGKAITLLTIIQAENPDYKDVSELIEKYRELNSNKNLQIFMLAPSADFVALCRKITLSYYAKSRTKILNISITRNEWVDISAEVETLKWTDTMIFRFVRSQGSIGELMVRDFHSRLKEIKAGKGICFTVGTFSEEARRFTEARLIDLIEKDGLLPILSTVDAKLKSIPPPARYS